MTLPNAQPTTSIISTARNCRWSYKRRPTLSLLDPPTSHRLNNSKTVERVAEARLPTDFGEFRIIGYRSLNSNEEFVVLVQGELRQDEPTLVRIHSQCLTGDVFGSTKCDCGQQLRKAMELIEREGNGAIVYQQQEGRGIGIINKIRAYALQDQGADTIEANEQLGLAVDLRSYEQCAEILTHLGVNSVRLMSNNPEKIRALEAIGLKVVERVSLETAPTDAASNYLRTKKEKMGHLLAGV
ncbi:MAG TPA: GTP cyclohydrolase II [Pyrinomonadaceae bacterium]|nr:GTP cyclohydrolase II [Pyrinomonadaceae bacterium]